MFQFLRRRANKAADYKINSRVYDRLREEHSKFLSETIREDYKSGRRVSVWKGSKGPMYGKKFSAESREKMRIARLGKPGAKWTAEQIEKARENNMGPKNPMYGRKYKMGDGRKKIGDKQRGKIYYHSPDLSVTKAFYPDEKIPAGWKRGNAGKYKQSTKDKLLNSPDETEL